MIFSRVDNVAVLGMGMTTDRDPINLYPLKRSMHIFTMDFNPSMDRATTYGSKKMIDPGSFRLIYNNHAKIVTTAEKK